VKFLRSVSLALAAVATTGAAYAAGAPAATATLKGAAGQGGTVQLWQAPQGVVLRVELTGVSPGWHAIHFHEKGDCSDAGFKAAGAHINHSAAKRPHGLLNPQGPDFGDLPNVHVGADGAGRAEAYTPLVSLRGEGGRPALLDADGSALVVHANPDDHATQPIGGAGDRIACGVLAPGG
jgi:Cu-Zn family superoxide dismutase